MQAHRAQAFTAIRADLLNHDFFLTLPGQGANHIPSVQRNEITPAARAPRYGWSLVEADHGPADPTATNSKGGRLFRNTERPEPLRGTVRRPFGPVKNQACVG